MSLIDNIMSASAELKNTASVNSLISRPENVPYDKIEDNPDNIFSANDTEAEIEQLASSIENMGLIHRPAVSAQEDGTYLILSGHRRVRAMRDFLHYETIPVEVYDNLSPEIESLIVYDANFVVRDNLTAEDKLVAYETYKDKLETMEENGELNNLLGYNGSIKKYIADRLGVSERTIRRLKNVSENATAEEREEIRSGDKSIEEVTKNISDRNKERKAKSYSTAQQEVLNDGRLIYCTGKKKDNGFGCEVSKAEIYTHLANYEETGSYELFDYLVNKYKDEAQAFENSLRLKIREENVEDTDNDI